MNEDKISAQSLDENYYVVRNAGLACSRNNLKVF